eukprot:GFYU01000689.1.p1 GENE.GFYU01000689.1~~GFYU01000689.1.p1  ORF type:complete len:301 (+),score=36.68 GFYU01000689.1:197-1099(+)
MGRTVSEELAEHIVPTAEQTGAWQLWILALLYMITAFVSVLEFFRFSQGQRLVTYRSGFLVLSFWVMFQRFLLVFFKFEPWTYFLLVFFDLLLPVFLQFLTFSLLAVFVAKCLLVIQGKEPLVRKYLYPAYAIVSTTLLIFCIVASLILEQQWHPDVTNFDRQISLYPGLVFTVLFIFVGVFGYKTYMILSPLALSGRKRQEVNKFLMVIAVYFALFSFRALWGLLYYFGVNPIQNMIGTWNEVSQQYYFTAIMVFYLVVEILPTLFVVISVRVLNPRNRSHSSLGGGLSVDAGYHALEE